MKQKKSKLRAELIKKRLEIPKEIAERAALALAENFLDIIPRADFVIAGYVPMRGEIDVMPLLKKLATRGNKICLPIIDDNIKILKFLSWSPDEELCAGKFGALCPPPHLPELVPDIIIVPLVAFDANLYRLGYGGGYYDATIKNLREQNKILRVPVKVIGAAYDMQQVEKLPTEAHDEKLDSVLIQNINYASFIK